MEAVWSRFVPAKERVVKAIDAGEIGNIVSLDVDFGFDGSQSPID